SLSFLLANYPNINIIYCSPEEFRITQDLRTFLQKSPNIKFTETTNFLEAISQADAIYMQRILDEWDTADNSLKHVDVTKYYLTYEHLNNLKPHCKILHPMPRRQELDPRIDADKRAEYWSQQRNGMWIRTGLIAMLMGIGQQL